MFFLFIVVVVNVELPLLVLRKLKEPKKKYNWFW